PPRPPAVPSTTLFRSPSQPGVGVAALGVAALGAADLGVAALLARARGLGRRALPQPGGRGLQPARELHRGRPARPRPRPDPPARRPGLITYSAASGTARALRGMTPASAR